MCAPGSVDHDVPITARAALRRRVLVVILRREGIEPGIEHHCNLSFLSLRLPI